MIVALNCSDVRVEKKHVDVDEFVSLYIESSIEVRKEIASKVVEQL